jgi:dTDP-4-dehydrorhamnose reductase
MIRTSMLFGSVRLGTPQLDVQHAVEGTASMTFFTDEVRCPAHADDVAAAALMLANRIDLVGPLHVAGPRAMSRADFAVVVAQWLGHDRDRVTVGSADEVGAIRPRHLVLDSSLAATAGIRCRDPLELLDPRRRSSP